MSSFYDIHEVRKLDVCTSMFEPKCLNGESLAFYCERFEKDADLRVEYPLGRCFCTAIKTLKLAAGVQCQKKIKMSIIYLPLCSSLIIFSMLLYSVLDI